MARGAQKQSEQTFRESTDTYRGANARSGQLYQSLFPILQGEATHPRGYDPKDLAAMDTASQQSVGGSTAGAVGEGNLQAARTRNAGGFAPALDEASREGGRTLATNALNTQVKNANLKESQRQSGIEGMSSLYGTNTNELLKALGLGNEATATGVEAGKSGWFQNMIAAISALKPGLSTGAGGTSASIG